MKRNVFTQLTEEELAVLCKAELRDDTLDPVCRKALHLIAEFEGLGPMIALNNLITVKVMELYPDQALVKRLQLEY